jgi:hypothetical protein
MERLNKYKNMKRYSETGAMDDISALYYNGQSSSEHFSNVDVDEIKFIKDEDLEVGEYTYGFYVKIEDIKLFILRFLYSSETYFEIYQDLGYGKRKTLTSTEFMHIVLNSKTIKRVNKINSILK